MFQDDFDTMMDNLIEIRFCNFVSFTKHEEQMHRKEEHNGGDSSCELCKSTHAGPNALLQHLEAGHFKLQTWKCEKCDFSSNDDGKLKWHMNLVHDAIHEYPYCDNKSANNQTFANHVKSVHDKIKEHKCPQCDYAATQKSHLRRHIKAVHDKIRKHSCSDCDFMASQMTGIRRHVNAVHNKIRDHKCPDCDYMTSYTTHLRRHMMAMHKKI
jgi:KRAB domain-containing zinc finger protein